MRHHKRQQVGCLRNLSQMEQLWHYNQHPHAHQSIQHQVAQCLAQHQTHRTSPCPLNQLGMQRSPFAGRTVYQSYTQKQRLLDDQHQHSRNQETGKPVRRIEQSHTLVQQRCGRHFILPHGGIPIRLICNSVFISKDTSVHAVSSAL